MKDGEEYLSPEQIEDEFEKKAIEAFLELRKNADIFINLLVLKGVEIDNIAIY